MSILRRTFTLTADDDGNDLQQQPVPVAEVIAVAWDAGDVGEATVTVAESEAPFLTVDVPGTYRPSQALDDADGQALDAVAQPFTLSGQILAGLSNGTPGGSGVLTVTLRR